MDRADRSGLGVALVAHGLLFVALTITIARRQPPVHSEPQAMDVQLVDAVGLQSSAPEAATEPPRQAEAPEMGPPVEATPPPAAPVPEPKQVDAKPEGDAPAKPTPPKAAPRLSSSFLKDLPPAKPTKPATAQRLGSDFLKGLPDPAAAGKGDKPRAALTGAQVNGLAAAIKRQVQPCYDLGALGGTPAMQITTVLQLRFNEDGSVAGLPRLVEQQGVTAANRSYAAQMVDLSRRAVLRCAPLNLPKELYAGGWENITMGFIPGQMQ